MHFYYFMLTNSYFCIISCVIIQYAYAAHPTSRWRRVVHQLEIPLHHEVARVEPIGGGVFVAMEHGVGCEE
jgi:hypothetical protein